MYFRNLDTVGQSTTLALWSLVSLVPNRGRDRRNQVPSPGGSVKVMAGTIAVLGVRKDDELVNWIMGDPTSSDPGRSRLSGRKSHQFNILR